MELPVGGIIPWSSDIIPSYFLLCDGQSLSIVGKYKELFDTIGYMYGGSDTEKSFRIPNIKGKIIYMKEGKLGETGGRTTITLSDENLPSHTHELIDPGHTHNIGDLNRDGNPDGWRDDGRNYWRNASYTSAGIDVGKITTQEKTNISIGNTGISKPFDITPPYIKLNYIIKYSSPILNCCCNCCNV